MKQLTLAIIVAIGLSMFGLLPVQSRDVGRLVPVEVLVAEQSGGQITVCGGSALLGRGESWAAALEDLQATADGTVFFGTVSAVVLADGAQSLLEVLPTEGTLRPAAQVYTIARAPDGDGVEQLAGFLQDRESPVTLQQLRAAQLTGETPALPRLVREQGRYRIAEHQSQTV